MSNFKILNDIPIFDYKTSLNDLLSQNILSWGIHNQICLNSIKGKEDDYHLGAASLNRDWNKEEKVLQPNGTYKTVVPLRKNPLKPRDFTELCTPFRKTVFEDLWNFLKLSYNIGRIRFMKSSSKTCLSWHTDISPRLHFPIKTQVGCFMVIEDEVKHLDEGKWWYAETTKLHTAFNGSFQDRIHLVVDILPENA